jgi:ribonuclease HI
MAQKKRFYAVRVGHRPGIYPTWDECRVQVDGYPNAVYKAFGTLEDAKAFLDTGTAAPPTRQPAREELPSARDRQSTSKGIVIYADGACIGNPGPGGYGVVLLYGDHRKEFSAGFRLTTNNRMEILACIIGLRALKEPCEVTLYSDSKYVVNTMSKSWALRWRRLGWKRKAENGELRDALNADLWAQMLDLCEKHRVQFVWVRGHSGNKENERCDELARTAAASRNLGVDTGYENPRLVTNSYS